MLFRSKYNAILDLMPAYNLEKSKEIIEQMGEKWVCHPANRVKKLDVPLDILKTHQSKVFKRKA